MEEVILVDEHDNETGAMEKLRAHIEGRLHRAFSVFIFNSRNELLLQQRAAGKYHSALLWTNTCCSHPRPGEGSGEAAVRRLHEEMGMACNLKKSFDFIYNAEVENGLTEHEYDHVYTGISDELPQPDSTEVAAWRYISLPALKEELNQQPDHFTAWFKICMNHWEKKLFG
jgi:isopentenyl-diphosphate delta-isomerase